MADIPNTPTDTGHTVPTAIEQQHQGILDKTLGEVLKTNPQAQGAIMQGMHISPEKFQQLLGMTGNNALMNTKIRDLFSSGIVQQALSQQGQNNQQVVQIDPNQLQLSPEQQAQLQAQGGDGVQVQVSQGQPQQQNSLVQKVKNLFGL